MKLDFAHAHFADAGWLWLAVLAPLLLVGLFALAGRARRRQLAALADPEFLAALLSSHSPRRRWIKNTLLVVALLLLGLALARPQWGEREEKSESLGEDVVFLLDCSASMLSPDVQPNRLARAKLAINDFAQHYSHGRIGLVAFAGQAFLQCPLTFDYDSFSDALNAVDEQTIPVPGTDIGRALAEGYAAVAKNERRKILVLVSDGEDLEQGSIRRAHELADKNVMVFTIGVGTAAGGQLTVTDAQGNKTLIRDEQGQPVVSRLDEPTLRAIAEATRGIYQPLGPLGQGLTRIREILENEEGIRAFVSNRREGVDHFQIPLALALVLVVAESLLGTRRTARTPRPLAGPILLAASLLLLPASLRAADNGETPAPSPRELFNQGTQKLQAKNLREAEAALDAAVGSNDEAVQVPALYNLGWVRFRAGAELLKGAPKPGDLAGQANPALQFAQNAIHTAETALSKDDLNDILDAYQAGRLNSQNLKQIQANVKGAQDTTAKVMARWLRAWGDFKSAAELHPNYANAEYNASIVDRNLAALKQQQQQLAALQQALGAMRQQLKDRLKALKKKMPGSNPGEGNPGKGGDDGEEDDGGNQPKDQQGEGSETPDQKDGQGMALSPDEAMQLLSSLHSDLDRKISAGDTPSEPKKRSGRNW